MIDQTLAQLLAYIFQLNQEVARLQNRIKELEAKQSISNGPSSPASA